MNPVDLEINRGVRRVLVRHWIDLGRISVRTISGKVHIRGTLERITGVKEPLSGAILEAMFADIRRLRGIARLNVELENWHNKSGLWHSTGKPAQTGSGILGVTDQTGKGASFQIGRAAADAITPAPNP